MTTAYKDLFHRAASGKILLILIALLVWSFFLWRAAGVFKPGVYSGASFESDCAIPIIMSNDDRPITLYNLYYYGTDRWGGWPMLFTQLFRRLTGYRWSDQSLSMIQTFWLMIGALAVAALSRRDRLIVGLIFLLALFLHQQTRYLIFLLSMVYAWQITALLFAWYSLRQLFDYALTSRNPQRWKQGAWLILAFWFSYLAMWSSMASVPFLFFILCLEVLRVRLNDKGPISGRQLAMLSLSAFTPVLLAAVVERLQKANFHRHAIKHFGPDPHFVTPLDLDLCYLTINFGAMLNHIIKLSWWPLYLIATLALLVIICMMVFAVVTREAQSIRTVKAVFSDDTAVLALGATGIAIINFFLTVSVIHVRINQHEDRYLLPTNLFGPIGGMLVVFLIINYCARRSSIREYAKPIFLIAGLALLTLKFPKPTYRYEYPIYTATASFLVQQFPRGILIGDYWGTYVFTALQGANGLTPVPLEGRENRMPWTIDMVRRTDQAVVEYSHSKLAENEKPPEHLIQHGNSLRLAVPKLYENGVYKFALYVRDK